MLAPMLALALAPALATDADLLKVERSGPPSCDGRGRYSPLPSSTSPSGPESGGPEGCCGRRDPHHLVHHPSLRAKGVPDQEGAETPSMLEVLAQKFRGAGGLSGFDDQRIPEREGVEA